MSVFESGAEPDHHSSSDQPQFRVAVRGYDRQEVAAYIQDLWAHIENERQRAEQAERTIAQMQLEITATKSQTPTFEHLGVEAGKVLEQAGQSAELLVEEAESRGKSLVDEARAQAAELIAAAERRAEEMRSSATEDARRALEEAHEAADRIRREAQEEGAEAKVRTDRMQSLHDSLLDHLGRVRQDLSALLGMPDEQAAADRPGERAEAEAETESQSEAETSGEAAAASARDGRSAESAVSRGR